MRFWSKAQGGGTRMWGQVGGNNKAGDMRTLGTPSYYEVWKNPINSEITYSNQSVVLKQAEALRNYGFHRASREQMLSKWDKHSLGHGKSSAKVQHKHKGEVD